MIPEFERHVNSEREFFEKSGVNVGVIKAEIRPKLIKLTVTMETNEDVADFKVWDKGSALLVEADVIVLNVPSRRTTVSKSIQPKRAQELIDGFEELAVLLTVRK